MSEDLQEFLENFKKSLEEAGFVIASMEEK